MTLSLFLGLLFGIPFKDDPAAVTPLPTAWQGTWSGTMVITGPTGKKTEVPLVHEVAPIPGTNEMTWVSTYSSGKTKVVKNYKLVPVAGQPDRFVIDERNGIGLEARLAGAVLYCQFEVGGSVLAARYELRGDMLVFEITTAKAKKEKTGHNVQEYRVDAVQVAVLRKQ